MGGVLSSPSPTSGALSASATHVAFTGATALRARACRAKLVGRNTLSVAFRASAVTAAIKVEQSSACMLVPSAFTRAMTTATAAARIGRNGGGLLVANIALAPFRFLHEHLCSKPSETIEKV